MLVITDIGFLNDDKDKGLIQQGYLWSFQM